MAFWPFRHKSKVCDLPNDIKQQAAFWLPVCPVHLIPDRDTLVLTHPDSIGIDIDEAKALAESFNAHFSVDAVRLHVLSPTCWVIGTNDAWQLSLPTLEDAIAMNLKDAFQSGKDAQRWRKLLNETQMLWFTHEVNIQREAKGLLPINGLWVLKQRAWWLFW